MKVLLDSCVWRGALVEVSAGGHDTIHAGAWPEDPGDDEILARARREGRVLVTLDKDFGELAVVRGLGHAGILRLVDIPAREQGRMCLRVLASYGAELASGAMITAEAHRLRIRPRGSDE